MRRFHCPACRAPVFFDDTECLRCSLMLAYEVTLDDIGFGPAPGCAGHSDCNWNHSVDAWRCEACVLSVIVPGPSEESAPFEAAIRRSLRQLHQAGITVDGVQPPLQFRLQSSTPSMTVETGHANGVITLDTAEGNPVQREATRRDLREQYRTPLGHVRHELGHWYWLAHVSSDEERLKNFRIWFGDERIDYAESLENHYNLGDDLGWRYRFLSRYASAHPWEDFAESFAHTLHMRDTLESAHAGGLIGTTAADFDTMLTQWQTVSVTLNELNRSMGAPDPYPFAPPRPAIDKLRWIHDLLTPLR